MNTTLLSERDAGPELGPDPERRCSTQPIRSASAMRRDIPLTLSARETVASGRRAVADIVSGRDQDRALVICGPCSVDDVNAASVYAARLRQLAQAVEDKLVVVMRTYFEKPRSVVGWKGLLYDPLTGGERSASAGIDIARRLAAHVNSIGLPCATEFLNPLLAPYLEDCMAYGSIGSRTVESQVHRELASRLEFPMGMKNGMDGSIASAVNAVSAARAQHAFFGQSLDGEACLVESSGNPEAHLILRGGSGGANYDAATVKEAVERGRALGLSRPVVVDCSHGNSQKNHRRQAVVFEAVLEQMRGGQNGIAGVMLESYLIEGRQDSVPGKERIFGQSITDACIGWKDTEYLVRRLADAL